MIPLPPSSFTEAVQLIFLPALTVREIGTYFTSRLTAFGVGLIGTLAINQLARQIIPLARKKVLFPLTSKAADFVEFLDDERKIHSGDRSFFKKIFSVAIMAGIIAVSHFTFSRLDSKTTSFALKMLFSGLHQGLVRTACSPMTEPNQKFLWDATLTSKDQDSFLEPSLRNWNRIESLGGNLSGLVQLSAFALSWNPIFSMTLAGATAIGALTMRALFFEEGDNFEEFVARPSR